MEHTNSEGFDIKSLLGKFTLSVIVNNFPVNFILGLMPTDKW